MMRCSKAIPRMRGERVFRKASLCQQQSATAASTIILKQNRLGSYTPPRDQK